MIKKTIVCIAIISVFLSIMTTVSAVDQQKLLEDTVGDVLDGFSETEEPASRPNVDITSLKYEKTGKIVTVSLNVQNKIENRGNMDDLYGEGSDDMSVNCVAYEIELVTDQNTYYMIYINNDLVLTDDYSSEEGFEPISYSASGSTLKVVFELKSEEEKYDSLTANAYDMRVVGFTGHWYFDYAPDDLFEEDDGDKTIKATAFGPSEAKVGEEISFTGEVDGFSSEYQWFWKFGDEESSQEQNPNHVFDKTGTYDVILEVFDSEGNSDKDIVKIKIVDENEEPTDDLLGFSSGLITFIILVALVVAAGVAVLIHVVKK